MFLRPKLLDWERCQRFACKRSPSKTHRLHATARRCQHSSREAKATADTGPLRPRAKMAIDDDAADDDDDADDYEYDDEDNDDDEDDDEDDDGERD